jgi:septum formation protein
MRLILASASPRRRELLDRVGLTHTVAPAIVTEHEDPDSCPDHMVRHNAELKARAVAKDFPNDLVLAADTTVALEEIVLNKPADLAEARAMLKRLSGRTHTVYTGVCLKIAAESFEETHVVTCGVTFNVLNDDAITRYFEIVNPLDKAGSYGIQAGKDIIIASHDEPLSNIMGLPVEFIKARLAETGLLARLG